MSNLGTEEFVRLLSRHQQQVYAFILTLVSNWADADEILQETSTVLWRKFAEFRADTDFVRWANQTAYFEVLKFRRRRQKDKLQFSEAFLEQVSRDALEMTERLQSQLDALAGCLAKLSPADQQLIQVRYERAATTKSAAAILGRPTDAVYKSLARVRAALMECVRRALAWEDRP